MNFTIRETQERIKRGDLTLSDLVSSYLSRIEERNEETNAFLSVFEEFSEKEEKKNLPLYGSVFAIKDNILVKGKRCTAGSKILEHYISPFDATVIEKIKKAGAVIIGKSNMDEFAMGSSTENSAFGLSRNPHNLNKVPGGSSGGSAVAVADAMCNAALGSDTGGSIRQPAAFCGVVGMKPTYGAVSRSGVIAMASSFDQVGPITKNVEDAELIFNVIAGKDDRDSVTLDFCRKKKKKKLKVGIPKEYFVEGIEKDTEKVLRKSISKIEKDDDIEVVSVSLPHTKYALPVYKIIMASEVSSNMARYDGIRYGINIEKAIVESIDEAYFKNRGEGFGKEVKRRIILGTYVLSAGYYDAFYVKAQKVRSLIFKDMQNVFDSVDVLLTPTTPTPAFDVGEKTEDPLAMYLSDMFTVTANLAGLPAITIPCGKIEELPIGAQVIANRFEEGILFEAAKRFEKIWKKY